MTDNKLYIVPYISTHGKIILANQMNHVLMDKDAEFEGDAKQLEQQGLAYTCIINDEPIASAGMKVIWDGVAEGWVLATNKVWNHPLIVARAIKKNFTRLAKENNIKRVQTAVRADFTIGLKFASWLGLENEGLMKRYGFDGSDHYRFARLF
jgi:RimJ/RimL family protein N-acetyltransferase